ncbi:hypothetical protein [Jeotgalibacillus campisalis]|nr:hypothetical protein [Jeotgalibacillus campisalis]
MNKQELLVTLILASRVGLLGNVPKNLRAIRADIDLEKMNVDWINYYEDQPTDEEIEALDSATGQVIAHFPAFFLNQSHVHYPYPKEFDNKMDTWIFMRWEDDLNDQRK